MSSLHLGPDAEREFFRRILSEVHAVIYINQLDPLRPIWGNGKYAEVLGYDHHEAASIGDQFFRDAVHPDDHDRVTIGRAERMRALGPTDPGVFVESFRVKHRDGSWRWFMAVIRPFSRTDDGRVDKVICVATDITEQFQVHDAIEDLVAENRRLRAKLQLGAVTGRELEVLAQIADGRTTPEISVMLCISVHTVDKHRRSLSRKLNARNVAELVRIAVELRLHVGPRVNGHHQNSP